MFVDTVFVLAPTTVGTIIGSIITELDRLNNNKFSNSINQSGHTKYKENEKQGKKKTIDRAWLTCNMPILYVVCIHVR